ncbi:hypothetical protein ACFVYP_25295 [Kitasatospora sp. NPDC058201]
MDRAAHGWPEALDGTRWPDPPAGATRLTEEPGEARARGAAP